MDNSRRSTGRSPGDLTGQKASRFSPMLETSEAHPSRIKPNRRRFAPICFATMSCFCSKPLQTEWIIFRRQQFPTLEL